MSLLFLCHLILVQLKTMPHVMGNGYPLYFCILLKWLSVNKPVMQKYAVKNGKKAFKAISVTSFSDFCFYFYSKRNKKML